MGVCVGVSLCACEATLALATPPRSAEVRAVIQVGISKGFWQRGTKVGTIRIGYTLHWVRTVRFGREVGTLELISLKFAILTGGIRGGVCVCVWKELKKRRPRHEFYLSYCAYLGKYLS